MVGVCQKMPSSQTYTSLRPYENVSCGDITKKAIDSHMECYHATGYVIQGLRKVCDLSIKDWLQVFATVRYPLDWRLYSESALEENINAIDEGLEDYLRCDGVIGSLAIKSLKARFEVNEYSNARFTNLIFNVADQVRNVLQTKYSTDNIAIYPFIVSIITVLNHITIEVQFPLIPRSDYDLNNPVGQTIEPLVLIDYFLTRVSAREFYPKLQDGAQIKDYTVCNDLLCQNSNQTVVQPVDSSFSFNENKSLKALKLYLYLLLFLLYSYMI